MNTRNYFIEWIIPKRFENREEREDMENFFKQDTINYQNYQDKIINIFTPYELIVIDDIAVEYKNKRLSKNKLIHQFLKDKLAILPILYQDKQLEIGHLVSTNQLLPTIILISYKYKISITLDIKTTKANEAYVKEFYKKGKQKEKMAFVQFLIEQATVKENDIIV